MKYVGTAFLFSLSLLLAILLGGNLAFDADNTGQAIVEAIAPRSEVVAASQAPAADADILRLLEEDPLALVEAEEQLLVNLYDRVKFVRGEHRRVNRIWWRHGLRVHTGHRWSHRDQQSRC
jgi:hypothetical protein